MSSSDDVVLAKAEIIERCLARVKAVYAGEPANLVDDRTKQDSILLNLQRACQASIDLALRLIRLKGLGLPKESRDAFALLMKAGLIPRDLAEGLEAMVGFRNVAVHEYRELDLSIVRSIIDTRLDDLREFASAGIRLASEG